MVDVIENEDGPTKESDATSVPLLTDAEAAAEAAAEAKDKLFEVGNADGSTSKLTFEEVQAKLTRVNEKESGADKKFREASATRQYTQEMTETFRLAKAGDVDAMRKLPDFPELGVTQEEVDELLNQGKKDEGASVEQAAQKRNVTLEDLPPDVQQELRESRKVRLAALKQNVHSKLDDALDGDDVVGHIMSGESDRLKKIAGRAREYSKQALKRRVAASAADGIEWKPTQQELQRVVQETRAFLSDMLEEDPLGPEAESTPTLGRTPLMSPTTLHRANTPPKRVASTDPKYADYLSEKTAYEQALAD